jgi:2-methylaconitate cis-trans-isomerase PrpF
VFFHRSDLPSDSKEWPFIFRAVLGSPDPHGRQLNGMGGGVSSLSKVCIVGPTHGPDRNRAEVEYTMVAVGVKDDKVDFSGNCGNISAAVGPWAWEEGVIKPMSEIRADGQRRRTVNMLNGNTGKVIR